MTNHTLTDRLASALAADDMNGYMRRRHPRRWRMSPDVADALILELHVTRAQFESADGQLFGLPYVIDDKAEPAFLAIESNLPEEGGQLVPDPFVESIRYQYLRESPIRDMFPKQAHPVALTWRQRWTAELWELRRRIAYAIYPFTEGDDD